MINMYLVMVVVSGTGLLKPREFPKAAVPGLFGTRVWFHGRQFFLGQGGGERSGDESRALQLLCTLFVFLLY